VENILNSNKKTTQINRAGVAKDPNFLYASKLSRRRITSYVDRRYRFEVEPLYRAFQISLCSGGKL